MITHNHKWEYHFIWLIEFAYMSCKDCKKRRPCTSDEMVEIYKLLAKCC